MTTAFGGGRHTKRHTEPEKRHVWAAKRHTPAQERHTGVMRTSQSWPGKELQNLLNRHATELAALPTARRRGRVVGALAAWHCRNCQRIVLPGCPVGAQRLMSLPCRRGTLPRRY